MANEATVNCSLQIRVGNLDYRSLPSAFQADVTSAKGPTPGAITALTIGTLVDLSQLTQPTFCRLMNVGRVTGTTSDDDYVEVGMLDPQTQKFYPMIELLPGESYVVRLARNIAEEYDTGTGTGSTGTALNRLMVRARTQSMVVLVDAFEA